MTTPAERTEAMTEPTQAQIEEAKQLRAKFAFRGSLDVYTNELASIIAYIRREARNAALEEAATYLETKRIITDNRVVCTRAEIEHDDYLLGHAAAIRALKDQP